MKWLRDIVTGVDGETHDVIRWGGALGTVAALFLSGWDVVMQHAHFDIQAYGIGFGALLSGVGAALKLKENTEPKAKESA